MYDIIYWCIKTLFQWSGRANNTKFSISFSKIYSISFALYAKSPGTGIDALDASFNTSAYNATYTYNDRNADTYTYTGIRGMIAIGK